MLIASWNVNGLRSAHKQGFTEWLASSDIDILCVQEIKVSEEFLTDELMSMEGYSSYFSHAEKKGYSGVAVYTKSQPNKTTRKVIDNERFNNEGRSLLLEFDDCSVLNVYLPHGGRDKSNLEYKLQVYDELIKFVGEYKRKPLVIMGDFNIAHHEIDLARPKQNRKNTMFTDGERAKLDAIIQQGYVDTYRTLNSDKIGYTWWPYMAQARQRNIGWRIDYGFIEQSLKNQLKSSYIFSDILGSDHCPIVIELDVT